MRTRTPKPARTGRWIIAGTLLAARYPCNCLGPGDRDCRTKWCPCWGRTDAHGMPELCCARPTVTPTEEPRP